ncbi:hypothetical protein SH1V18_03140 [Vallitalea longa]|uniref:Uncharacterized protein n=1 Tax=Vallitalea longa TaxID=2936439 RepID=A0A9W5Y9G0_9FIRM|nr:hypothetical protein [Vallitalea longa]GKX27834.1 hypothetical protein SH1V18_03140 [Vallitalea longa]
MKKLNILILTILITISLCSCNNANKEIEESNTSPTPTDEQTVIDDTTDNNEDSSDDKGNDEVSQETGELEIIKKVEKMTDEELLDSYIYNLEICCPEFDFNNATELDADELYKLFLYSLFENVDSDKEDELYDEYHKQWYNEELSVFQIEVEDIKKQLDKYLKEYTLDIGNTKLINTDSEKIETPTITGFGGNAFPKIKEKSLNGNQLELTVDFYDESYNNIIRSKIYILEFYNDGYYIIKDKLVD